MKTLRAIYILMSICIFLIPNILANTRVESNGSTSSGAIESNLNITESEYLSHLFGDGHFNLSVTVVGKDRYETSLLLAKRDVSTEEQALYLIDGRNNYSGAYIGVERCRQTRNQILLFDSQNTEKLENLFIGNMMPKHLLVYGAQIPDVYNIINSIARKYDIPVAAVRSSDSVDMSFGIANTLYDYVTYQKIYLVQNPQNNCSKENGDECISPDALAVSSFCDGPAIIWDEAKASLLEYKVKSLGIKEVVAVGGKKAIPDSILKRFETFANTSRIGGANRFETSAMIANMAYPNGFSEAFLVPEGHEVDGLSVQGKGSPVIVVPQPGNQMTLAAKLQFKQLRGQKITLVGQHFQNEKSHLTLPSSDL